MSLARRVAVTVALPVALLLVARVPLPGVDMNAIVALGGQPETFGVLAVGLVPYLSASWLVELVAFLVPRLSPLRDGSPEGRATLQRWSLRLAIVIAIAQGFALATQLAALEATGPGYAIVQNPGIASTLSITFTIVAGVALQLVAASVVTRYGLANGVVVLVGVGLARDLVAGFGALLRGGAGGPFGVEAALGPAAVLRVVLLAATVVVATWFVTRAREASRPQPAATDGPYRAAKRFVTDPEIPIPASSIQPYAFAMALMAVPSTLAALRIPGASALVRFFDDDRVFFVVGAGLLVATSLVFAWVLHRPREIAALARGLASASEDATKAASVALRRAMPASLVYVVGLFVVANGMTKLSALSIALLAAIVLDLGHAALAARGEERVAVWEERRAAALPIAEEALRTDGIAVTVTGTRLLALLQVFAPYAPAVLSVPAGDAERARAVLRHVLAGGPAPEPRADEPLPRPKTVAAGSPLVPMLATFVVGAILAGVASYSPPRPHAAGPRPVLELVRVDDDTDPFASIARASSGVIADDEPPVPGVAIRVESVPGPRGPRTVHYARISLDGTTREAALANAGPWLATIPKPEGTRFAFEDVLERSSDGEHEEVVAVRSFLLTGKAEVGEGDVKEAALLPPRDGMVGVGVTLTEAGAARFEALTEEWTKRRLAIVLDGEVKSAPVIMSKISGGHLTITMGRGNGERELAEANRLVDAFR